MVSLGSKPSSYDHFSVFKSTAQIPSAVEPACGATKSLLRQPPRIRERKVSLDWA
jgi:hypothetical protein